MSSRISSEEHIPRIARLSRAYNNPYHPEDDGIIENISDEDGDNLRYGVKRSGELTDSEKVFIKQKKIKINGRYYDMVKSPADITYNSARK